MELFRTILRWKLKKLARLTVWRYRPGIVGITGSVGKTSTKFAIAAALASERRVRAAGGNLNNDIGLALTILGDWSERELALVSRGGPKGKKIRKGFFWAKVIWLGFWRVVFFREYPEILILEYGVDRPGDMKALLSIARPNISIITAIGDIPVHVEFFAGPDEVAREKGKLIDYLPVAGFAILNYDDASVMRLQNRTRAHVMTYGFGKGAEVRISNFADRMEGDRPAGISFKLESGGKHVPVRLDNIFGKAQAYAAAAAAAVGMVFGMNLIKVAEALKNYHPAHGRMQLIPGVKHTYIIDDSYNASPLSMHAALDTVRGLKAKRTVAVLGDMLELGEYAVEAHEHLGRLAAQVADVLVTVGPRAKFIAEGAKTKRMRKQNIVRFDTAEEAAKPVELLLKKGDLVLIKASRAMELEKIVEEIKAF